MQNFRLCLYPGWQIKLPKWYQISAHEMLSNPLDNTMIEWCLSYLTAVVPVPVPQKCFLLSLSSICRSVNGREVVVLWSSSFIMHLWIKVLIRWDLRSKAAFTNWCICMVGTWTHHSNEIFILHYVRDRIPLRHVHITEMVIKRRTRDRVM